ncbi:MAG: metallophosphoesterase [Phycisphaeraceae bacterium]|nr:MAG: metallophosphoesterase [Phycisphaeraceae bacterium]
MHHDITRRGFLAGSAALAAGAVSRRAHASENPTPGNPIAPTLRIAHVTDTHIQPERAADQGVAHALRHLHDHHQGLDLVITGGDSIMDAFAATRDRTQRQWDLWSNALKEHCPTPVASVIGNHDIWGWDKPKSGTLGTEPGWGKKWVCDIFGREKPYTSRDAKGWHVVLLDSVRVDKDDPNGYEAFLDEEQFEWLDRDLGKAGPQTPVLIVSHIPILAACVFAGAKPNDKGDVVTTGGLRHTDFPRLNDLFRKHKNVKLCLSGHIHLLDRVEYDGVTYICAGAVSGRWWQGDHRNTPPGYSTVDLAPDGSFTYRYHPTGWQPRA